MTRHKDDSKGRAGTTRGLIRTGDLFSPELQQTLDEPEARSEVSAPGTTLRKGAIGNVITPDIYDIIQDVIVNQDDLVFTHSVFVQCFLPMRSLPKDSKQRWEVTHGRASMLMKAGELADPRKPGQWEQCEVPAGAKARLLFAYINNFAIKENTSEIDMGKSLRVFMDKNQVPIGGANGREITKQLKNIAAADITFGMWKDNEVTTRWARVGEEMCFWLEKDAKQGTLWQPTMTLSPKYFAALQEHRVPLYFPALVQLQANPRAMDLYCWLVYRMRHVRVPVKIPYVALHPIFGPGIQQLKHFKVHFRNAVIAAHKFYPEARVAFKDDYFILYPSPQLIPAEAPKAGRA